MGRGAAEKGPTNECGSVIMLLSNKCVWTNAPFALRQPTLAQLMMSYKQSLRLVALCYSYLWIGDILHLQHIHSLCDKKPNILSLRTLRLHSFASLVFGRGSFPEKLTVPFNIHFARCICREMSTIFSQRWKQRVLLWLTYCSVDCINVGLLYRNVFPEKLYNAWLCTFGNYISWY